MKLDLLIHHADIRTQDPLHPRAHTLGVLGGRVVGLDSEVTGIPARRTVDLHHAVVLPGFNDAHCHTTWYGLTLASVDLLPARSLDDVYRAIAARAAVSAPGAWVVANGFDHHHLGGRYPDIDELDKAAGGRPVYIRHMSGHASIVNTATLRLAGVFAPDFAEPVGGGVRRRPDGRPSGLLEEQAQHLVQDLVLPYSQADIAAALERATRVYAAEGITSFTEAGIAGGWIGHSPVELAAYQTAREDGRLHARAQLMVTLDALHPVVAHPDDHAGIGLDLGLRTGMGDDHLSIGPTKVFVDGSLFGETAAVSEPYCTAQHREGYFQLAPDDLRARMLDAYRSGWSLAAHAIGDRAIDLALDIMAEARVAYGPHRVPNRLEHGGVIRPDQIPALAAAGVAVVPQPNFLHQFGDGMARSLGPARTAWSYRVRSLLEAGVCVPGSSDRPCADGVALRGVQAFVERLTGSGATYGPGERVTAEQAVRAYTVGSAAATGFAGVKGALATGQLADFVVLSAAPSDVPAEEISAIEVLATSVGGRFTHDALGLAERTLLLT